MEFEATFQEFKSQVLSINGDLETLIPKDMDSHDFRNYVFWVISLINDAPLSESVSLLLGMYNIELSEEQNELFVQILEKFKPLFEAHYDNSKKKRQVSNKRVKL
jgi:hypothetical protein